MSIVITALISNNSIVMCGDKRGTNQTGTKDAYTKIFRITNNAICGITGHLEWGLKLIEIIKGLGFTRAADVMKIAMSMPPSTVTNCTFTYAGVNEDGKLFISNFRSEGLSVTDYIDKCDGCLYSTFGWALQGDKAKICTEAFNKKYLATYNIGLTMKEAIKIASSISPETISPVYDTLIIKAK